MKKIIAMCLRSMLRKQNTGVFSSSLPLHLRPYVLLAYIVGFDRNTAYMEEIKGQWVDRQKSDVINWMKSTEKIISFDDDLKVIYLSREWSCAAMLAIAALYHFYCVVSSSTRRSLILIGFCRSIFSGIVASREQSHNAIFCGSGITRKYWGSCSGM